MHLNPQYPVPYNEKRSGRVRRALERRILKCQPCLPNTGGPERLRQGLSALSSLDNSKYITAKGPVNTVLVPLYRMCILPAGA